MGTIHKAITQRQNYHSYDFLVTSINHVASVQDPNNSTYGNINKITRSFINSGSTLTPGKIDWIHQNILYGPKSEGGLNFIDV